ncbi:MAG: 4-hydroxy-tetrahydrodipicolinate reductase [Ilumatobacteraceae bacterium]
MKIGLMGFGKTGKSVSSTILNNQEICLNWVIRKSHLMEHRSVPEFLGVESHEPGLIYSIDEFSADELFDHMPVDVVVDFSSSNGVDYYGDAAARRGIAIVSAISHYEEEKIELLKRLSTKTRVLWSPNITLGINFLILAAKVLKKIAPYTDIEVIEEHFRLKPEISGTALRIANELDVDFDDIKSIRAGGIIGTHEVLFGFPFQTVRLRHESISREAFGMGAMFAAEHLLREEIGFYRMEDLMKPYFLDFPV